MPSVAREGIEIHYEVCGSGPPVVLVLRDHLAVLDALGIARATWAGLSLGVCERPGLRAP